MVGIAAGALALAGGCVAYRLFSAPPPREEFDFYNLLHSTDEAVYTADGPAPPMVRP
jgi:hypothetical protein